MLKKNKYFNALIMPLAWLALIFLASCAGGEPGQAAPEPETGAPPENPDGENAEPAEPVKFIEVIADPEFKNGFICGGATHEDGIIGELTSPVSAGAPSWKIAQWACRYDISKGAYAADGGGYSYITESQKVAVSWREGEPLLTLELKASKEYDAPRISWQPWPHLLIEQTDLAARCPDLDKLERLDLILDTRIAYCDSYMDNADPGLHAAQVTLFFTVQSSGTGDMYWFGVPIFDNRQRLLPEYMAEDSGKDDASHKFIYTVAQKEFTRTSAREFTRLRYEADLLPYIKKGLERAYKAGYLNSNDIADYTLTTCNLGYELPGTYDSAFELYSFTLGAVLK